jgi:glucose/mannose-6-phosphate isomerase
MKKLIMNFVNQLKHALKITEDAELTESDSEIRNVVIHGMGSSGIAGNIAAGAIALEVKIPITVNKDFSLPNYVNKHTLVIITSYSGDTEETVTALEEAIVKHAKIVCITSGGKIREIATQRKIDLVLIPKDLPPRGALGYLLVQILHVLNFNYLIFTVFKKHLLATINLITAEENNIVRDARETAQLLIGKWPVIYTSSGMESVALRFHQQLNENAKMLCSHNVFPELNHNELQGWKKKNGNIFVVIFRNETDDMRTSQNIDISGEIISHYGAGIKEVYSRGNSLLEQMLYHIHWGDWVSYFLAEMRGIDTMDTREIIYFKSAPARVEQH